MTPKEYEIVYATIEHAMFESYRRGRADQAAGKPEEEETRFKLSKASRLLVKTNLEKATKTR